MRLWANFAWLVLICMVEAIRRLKINDNWDRDAAAQSTQYPDRPGEPECLYYLRTGACGYGSNCRYHHPAHISIVRAFSLICFSFFVFWIYIYEATLFAKYSTKRCSLCNCNLLLCFYCILIFNLLVSFIICKQIVEVSHTLLDFQGTHYGEELPQRAGQPDCEVCLFW